MHTIYTLGYSGSSHDDLGTYAAKLDAVVVDVRWSPRSRAPQWNKRALAELLGERYVHLRAFGNENYKGGPVKLHDPQAAVETLRPILAERPVILVCACSDVARCHRKDAAEVLAGATGAPVVHLPPRFECYGMPVQLVMF